MLNASPAYVIITIQEEPPTRRLAQEKLYRDNLTLPGTGYLFFFCPIVYPAILNPYISLEISAYLVSCICIFYTRHNHCIQEYRLSQYCFLFISFYPHNASRKYTDHYSNSIPLLLMISRNKIPQISKLNDSMTILLCCAIL